MIVIGSVAAKHWLPNFRTPQDIDLWMSKEELKRFYEYNKSNITKFQPQRFYGKFTAEIDERLVEIGLYDECSPEFLIEKAQCHDETVQLFGFDFVVPSLKSLATIKKSHIEFPLRQWFKHIEDYHILKEAAEYQDFTYQHGPTLDEALKGLRASAAKRYGSKNKPKLSMSNDEFFARSQRIVNRIYNHDDIHLATCYYQKPLYTRMKHDINSAKCDKDLWDTFSHEDKIKAVQEEAFVIALERYIIPKCDIQGRQAEVKSNEAFRNALMRICTTLTGGWFREFAIEHWLECKHPGKNYVREFQRQLSAGQVRSYE